MDDDFKRAALDYQAGRMTVNVAFYLEMLRAKPDELLEVPEIQPEKPKPTMKDIQSLGLLNSPVHQAWRQSLVKKREKP